jgi:hypothetical protein
MTREATSDVKSAHFVGVSVPAEKPSIASRLFTGRTECGRNGPCDCHTRAANCVVFSGERGDHYHANPMAAECGIDRPRSKAMTSTRSARFPRLTGRAKYASPA